MKKTQIKENKRIKRRVPRAVKKGALSLFGCLVYAASISLFLEPSRLASGGVFGISLMLNHFAGLPVGTMMLIINLPLFVVGFIKFGKEFALNTVLATTVSSLLIDLMTFLTKDYLPITDDMLLSATVGGAFLGVGMGMVFRAGGTTGGMDIVVKLIRSRKKNLKTGRIYFTTDTLVIIASAFVFADAELGLYAAVALFVSCVTLDLVLYGSDSATLVYVISDMSEAISARLLGELEVGTTLIEGSGGYTNSSKRVLFCAVKKPVFPKLREIVAQEDENAFMIVTRANEIFGEGFKKYRAPDL